MNFSNHRAKTAVKTTYSSKLTNDRLSRTHTKALPLIIGVTLILMLLLMVAMTRVGAAIGTIKPSEEELELYERRNDSARMERILISTTSLA